jgi:hypothetical protein
VSIQDVIGVTEAVSAALVPLGGGLAASLRWRKNAQREREARSEAARISGERAAEAARAEVRAEQARADAVNTLLLSEKDKAIERLQADLMAERAENASLQAQVAELMKRLGRGGSALHGT